MPDDFNKNKTDLGGDEPIEINIDNAVQQTEPDSSEGLAGASSLRFEWDGNIGGIEQNMEADVSADDSGYDTEVFDTTSTDVSAPAQKKTKKSRKKKKRAKAMAAREEALRQAGLLTDTEELTSSFDTDTLELSGSASGGISETVVFDITDVDSSVPAAEMAPVSVEEVRDATAADVTAEVPAEKAEPARKSPRGRRTKKSADTEVADTAVSQTAESEERTPEAESERRWPLFGTHTDDSHEPVNNDGQEKAETVTVGEIAHAAVHSVPDLVLPDASSVNEDNEPVLPDISPAETEPTVYTPEAAATEETAEAGASDETADSTAVDANQEQKTVKKSRKKKKAAKKAAVTADPFQKTDGALEREGNDLLNELAVTNGEQPVYGKTEAKTPDDDGQVSFDAVVNENGAISGVLDEKEVKSSEKEEIPAVIAAASDKGKKKTREGVGKTEKKSKKDKKTDKNVVTGTSAKITGARTKKVRKRASFFQILVRLFIILICIGILGGCALAVGVTMYIADVTADDDKILNIDNIKLSLATSIMVQDPSTGEWMEHERIYGGENREWVPYSDFPDCLIDSIIASEDIRFRTHHGVDWKRTAFAFLNQFLRIFGVELASNIQGGSTITQQLIKNITDEKQVEGLEGILRKVREIYRALEMEKNYSKTQILEAYLNTFRLGGQVAGIESAAKYYFGKTTSELDLAECCAIVCITKYPSAYNPYVNPEENKEQREFILYTMLENEMITRTQYDAAIAESDEMVFDEANISAGATSNLYDYFTDVVIDQVYEDLKTYKNLSADDAYKLLYEGGLKIYTTMNPDIQHACEKAAWDRDIWPDYEYDDDGNKLENQIEGAIVVMDYEGRVLGCAGGIREKTTSLSLSRAYSTTRQTGSSMKPLAVYAPAIEMKKIHFSTLFPDVASDQYNGYPWPRNFSYTYGSPITVYKAVCDSLNTVAALTMQLVGPDFSFEYLTSSLGFTTLVDSRWDDYQGMYLTDRTKSLALGGLTDGCTVTEMCAAYATFGNAGVYKSPRYYTYIEDSNGDLVLDKNKVCQTNQAMTPQTAYIMNQILQGVTREGTGTALKRGAEQVTASKTGTSSDNNDFWVCALNPYYCAAGWMGYDLNGWMNYSKHYDIQYAVRDVLNEISNDLPYKEFDRPDGIVTATFCMSSGDIATSSCSNRRTGYYTSDNYPSGSCMHNLYNNDGNGGYYSSES